jgi:monovalent cation:H+ antiporter, CPA1 family
MSVMLLVDLLTLLIVATASIAVANRLTVRLPPTIAMLASSLVICAFVLGLDPLLHTSMRSSLNAAFTQINLPNVFLNSILGLLLFSASLNVSIEDLRQNSWMVVLLAIGSVAAATWLFAGCLYWSCQWLGIDLPFGWCAVVGAVLAPTDAVVVDGLLHRLHLPHRLRTVIVSESLLNDGAGVVLFITALRMAAGEHGLVGHGRVAEAMLIAGGGGILIGATGGWAVSRLMRLLDDPGLNLLLSMALVLATYRLAQWTGVSGPVAVAIAGLALGIGAARGTEPVGGPDRWRHSLVTFWSLLNEMLTAVLFLMIGLQVASLPFTRIKWAPVLLAVPLALFTRLASVSLPMLVVCGPLREKARFVAVLTWAGMRGGVSVAMILSAPASQWHDELLAIAYAVVLSSVLAQGMTMRRLVQTIYQTAPEGMAASQAQRSDPIGR